MSLTILYTDPISKENKELFIKVCLNTDYNSENTITEHPSETKVSFIDNSLQKLKEIPVTVFVPAEDEVETGELEEAISSINASSISLAPKSNLWSSNNKSLSNTFSSSPVSLQNANLNTRYISKIKIVTKEAVLETLEMLKNKAIFLNLDINNRTYIKYIIKSISFPESIDSGDGLEIKLSFIEARVANSKKTVLSKETIEALKKALAESIANERVMAKIAEMNKIGLPANKGSVKSTKDSAVDQFRKSFPVNEDTFLIKLPNQYVILVFPH